MLVFVELVLLLVVPIAIAKIYCILTHRNCNSKVCLVGKTALVTGGYSGIGYQIVLALAQRGCRVIIADKSQDQNLLEKIYEETRSRNIVCKYVDLSSFKSVRELAYNVIKDEGKLDILINNAGIGRNVSSVTEDGLDITMQVNYFSAFLLTRSLEDLLKKTGGRIIFTGSGSSHIHNFTIDRLKPDGSESFTFYTYFNSKLCLIMISDTFAERLKGYGVTSNAYHPGLVRTNIFRSGINLEGTINKGWFTIKFLEYMSFVVGKTAEEGAQTAIHLACSNEVEGVTGGYFFETKPTFRPKIVHDKKMCNDLWEATEEIVKQKLS
ncbi:retinol dehydrogenase 13-like [Anoplophora glabripennis]|uniref:retinol dehydrogenase 13-like n=1 Tax=Anoplophora glabripennis TaxID=217634 RepID=UPI000874C31A|nr:retinol dehydrogenase 13-like [Anoplophora glabripennis]